MSEPVTVEISSERDSPVIRVTIEEEVASMSVGLSLVQKKKRGAQQPMFLVQKKQKTRTSVRALEEEPAQTCPSNSGVE